MPVEYTLGGWAEGVMSESKKCAHEKCSCMAAEGSKYCSTFCQDSVGKTTLSCDCPHTGCAGHI